MGCSESLQSPQIIASLHPTTQDQKEKAQDLSPTSNPSTPITASNNNHNHNSAHQNNTSLNSNDEKNIINSSNRNNNRVVPNSLLTPTQSTAIQFKIPNNLLISNNCKMLNMSHQM